MLAKISTFLDAAEYEKAFETNLNEGISIFERFKDLSLLSWMI